jgi:hypothetical protein
MSTTTEEFLKVIDEHDLSKMDSTKLSSDLHELNKIANSLPRDNILSMDNCLNLERLCIRGMNICDYWYPIIHIIMSENESIRDILKNKAYINAKPGDSRLTIDMRKACSETDEEYNKAKIVVEKIKAMKLFFEKRRDTFKSAIFVFKDQLASYKVSDKGNSGEEIYFPSSDDKEPISYGKTSLE